MAKYLIQDIIPPNKKTRLAADRGRAPSVVAKKEPERKAANRAENPSEVFTPRDPGKDQPPPRAHFGEPVSRLSLPRNALRSFSLRGLVGNWVTWIGGALVLGLFAVAIFNFFAGAEIIVLPKRDVIPLDQRFTALKNPEANELPYAVMKLVLSESMEVAATGQKAVTEKASGKVIIYNKQAAAQRLIKNTRFQSTDGKIYRINESVTVPRGTGAGLNITPGTLAVTVYADEAGSGHNADPQDFTLPGLKGGPLFEKVYARSSGPITGGASGTIKTVSDNDMKQASADLRVALETKLRSKARGDVSPSQIGYDPGIIVELGTAALANTQASRDDKAVITQEGTLYMVLFDRKAITTAIVGKLIPGYKGEPVNISNLESLEFSMGEKDGDTLWENDKLELVLKGSPKLEWIIDESALKNDLIDTPKDNFNILMSKYTNIEKAKATLSPFWKTKFPSDPQDIEIVVVDVMEE